MKTLILNFKGVLFLTLIIMLITTTNCRKDDDDPSTPGPTHEEELITTLKLNFINQSLTSDTFSYEWKDIDGDGGNDPVIDSIILNDSSKYNVSIQVLNESVSPVEDITEEISAESDEHFFCFKPSNSNLQIKAEDSDGNYAIGLKSSWLTYNTDNSSISITLKHQPGSKDGTCDPGETDIQVSFPVIIK